MSDVSEEEDSIDNIDFSVISTAIETGGKTLDQILNAVHYGSPEVQYLLRETCDFIFECKYCKNLFRAIPNFVAHKRIYCGEKSFFPRNTPKKKSKKKEEVVVVRPVSPSLSASVETTSKEEEKTVLEQILTGSFQGNSDAYKVYTEAAVNVEKQKINTPTSVLVTTSIKNTQNAVNINVVDAPDQSSNGTVSNASAILAKAKKSRKQPLTKIVDGLKKTAKISKVGVSEVVTDAAKPETVPSPKRLPDKKVTTNTVSTDEDEKLGATIIVQPTLTSATPQKNNSKTQTKSDGNSLSKKEKADAILSEQKAGKVDSSTTEKSAKVVLTPIKQKASNSEKGVTGIDISSSQKPASISSNTVASKKVQEKKQVSKSASSNDLRPVKSQDGSELSELSQLGHCDLNQLKCLICNLQYSQKKTLLQHMHVIHSGSKTKYPCNMCNKKFDYFWGLTRHLLLNHKKTKEEVDRMRPELRALAYTVTESDRNDDRESTVEASEKQGTSSRASRMKQISKTLLKMSTCNGCNKSFWKKSNYEEHVKQCRFLLTITSPTKEKKEKETKETDKKSSTDESAARRRRTLEKLAESRKTKIDSDDSADEERSNENSQEGNRRAVAASKRPRIDGKFISKKQAEALLEKEKTEKDDKEKLTSVKHLTQSKGNISKSKVVKGLKEKSHSFVPTQRFISTRRSAAFFHSPAHRTRFHEKRRAVVPSPKKETRSPSKSSSKSYSEPTTPSVSASSDKKSPEQKSELEVARRNLLNAIEKVKRKDNEENTEKSFSPVKQSNAVKTSIPKTATKGENEKSNLAKQLASSGESELLPKEIKEETVTPDVGRSRPVRRTQNTPVKDGISGEQKDSGRKTDKNTPSRDTSVESVRSHHSTRSHKDTSRELSGESTSRSRQTIRSVTRDSSRDVSSESLNRSPQSRKSENILKTDVSEYRTNPRSRSRDTSAESTRSSHRNINTEKVMSNDEKTPQQDTNKDVRTSRSSTRNVRSGVTESRDSSRESIRTCSSENLADIKLLTSRRVPRRSESQESDKSEEGTAKKVSPQSNKNLKEKSMKGHIDEKKEKENSRDTEKRKESLGGKNLPQEKPENKKGSPKSTSSNKSPGKDEIDGLQLGGQVEKAKPKWSSKKWAVKTPESNESKDVKEEQQKITNVKSVKQDVTSVKLAKGKISKSKEILKGVTKQKILKGKARYSFRSVKARVQAAKNIGELKKRYPTRISELKKDNESNEKDSKKTNESDKIKKSPAAAGNTDKKMKSEKIESAERKKVAVQSTEKDETASKADKVKRESLKKTDSAQQVDDDMEDVNEGEITTYSHRQRQATDLKGVKVIEEIWVSKEPGKPLQNVKCKKTIIDSPKKLKSSRMYVVDPVKPEKPKCMDFSRINHLVDYKNNKCLQCGIELTDISSLRRHAVRHLGWKRYKCKLCAYTGFNRSECNSHIKRRHTEKLVSSSAPLATFIIDLNKEASNVRNKKKQSTLQRKNTENKKSVKTKSNNVKTPAEGRTLRKSTKKDTSEEIKSKEEQVEDTSPKIKCEKSEESVQGLPVGRTSRSNSVPSVSTVSPHMDSVERETKLSRKRKRAVSGEDTVAETKGDNLLLEKSNSEILDHSENGSELAADNLDDLDEDIRSVSDYEDNDGNPPSRNVVSPTWTKMNPNVALMMATLEEARATKFSRGKRGRGGIRRFSSPLKKHTRLSTEDSAEQEQNSRDDEDEDLPSNEDGKDSKNCKHDGDDDLESYDDKKDISKETVDAEELKDSKTDDDHGHEKQLSTTEGRNMTTGEELSYRKTEKVHTCSKESEVLESSKDEVSECDEKDVEINMESDQMDKQEVKESSSEKLGNCDNQEKEVSPEKEVQLVKNDKTNLEKGSESSDNEKVDSENKVQLQTEKKIDCPSEKVQEQKSKLDKMQGEKVEGVAEVSEEKMKECPDMKEEGSQT